jgi:Methylase involved in ubiquinone/menaquinone biosynthesis
MPGIDRQDEPHGVGARSTPGGIGSAVWKSDLSDAEQDRLTDILERLATDPFLRRVAQRSIELMEPRAGDDLLDVGCGTGVLLPLLAELATATGTVTGIDYAADLIEAARTRVASTPLAARIRLVQGDATSLPFKDDSFDAAHVERVLMHLEDPDAAIREMCRVVRPGGWVVAAEPDTTGVRIDHPADPEAMALMMTRELASFQNPGMGLELNRRFAQAGLVDRKVEPMIDADLGYDAISAEGDRLSAAALVADGVLTTERAEAAIAYLEAASDRGEYTWLGTMIIVAGRVPEGIA